MSYTGLIILALITVGVVYGVARLMAASRRISPRIVPLFTGVAIVVALAVVMSAFPRRTFVPSTVTVGLRGFPRTDTFYLQGSYTVTWTASPVGASSCRLDATLVRASDNTDVAELVSVVVQQAEQQGESPALEALSGGGYVVDARSDCDWKVTFRPT